jgi:hypothetical protein
MFLEAYLDLRKNSQSSASQIAMLTIRFLKASRRLAFKNLNHKWRRFAPPLNL